jgi:hypothetical protein
MWDTTCYDLTGIATLIPSAFRAAFASARSEERVVPPPAPGPDLPDPFAESSSDSLSNATEQTPLCPVFRQYDEPGKTEKAPSLTPGPLPFAGPEMAAIRKGDASPRVAPGAEATAFRGLRAEKVSAAVVRNMLTSNGARWCLTLLAYGRWTRRKTSVGPGWFVAVWQHWKSGDGGWPDAFLDWYANEKSHARRATGTVGNPSPQARKAPPRLAVPQRPAAPRPAVDGRSLSDTLASLSDGERAALEARAKAALRAELGREPVPPLVRSRMRALLAQEETVP